MTKNRFDLLIVGSQRPLEETLGHLESEGNYRLCRCPDFHTARGYLAEHTPNAIIAAFDAADPHAIDWLETVRGVAPVVVFCPFADLEFYRTVMDHGAFDFFTPATPLEEVDRELNNAVNGQACQAA